MLFLIKVSVSVWNLDYCSRNMVAQRVPICFNKYCSGVRVRLSLPIHLLKTSDLCFLDIAVSYSHGLYYKSLGCNVYCSGW